jgi:hypothetical protein
LLASQILSSLFSNLSEVVGSSRALQQEQEHRLHHVQAGLETVFSNLRDVPESVNAAVLALVSSHRGSLNEMVEKYGTTFEGIAVSVSLLSRFYSDTTIN